MKPRLIVPLAALLASLLPAQNPAPVFKSHEELTKLRAEKLAKPVFTHAPWVTDFDKAREQAKQQNKLLFTYFTRSYAA
jgi:hypothetical protein